MSSVSEKRNMQTSGIPFVTTSGTTITPGVIMKSCFPGRRNAAGHRCQTEVHEDRRDVAEGRVTGGRHIPTETKPSDAKTSGQHLTVVVNLNLVTDV